MQNEILINATPGETRVALLEKKQFVELHIERTRGRSVEGSVVKGRVRRVLPGMQAAFVDVGLEKAAFLYAGDYVENIEELDEEENGGGRRRRNRFVPNIGTLLEEGQEIVVQIVKEPIGSKGARVTSHVSIAGRHLVLTPWSQRVGVSRRIGESQERRRLRAMVDRIKPADLGFIIRTVGERVREDDIKADLKYLTRIWDDIQIKKDRVRAPTLLYEEPTLALRVIRDLSNADTKRIVIDNAAVHEELKNFLDEFVLAPRPELQRYRDAEPIFDHFGAEPVIDANLGRRAKLKSGGYLIIDQSEALTAIDVNTGRYVGKRDIEETVLKTNLEAVQEVVNQLRFRNIGGLIIIDLIDMDSAENRNKVNRALQEAFKQDKARTNILKISELGLVEMTRKRTRENLVQMLCEPCAYCGGKGYVVAGETMAHRVLRELHKDLPRFSGRRVLLTVARRVAEHLLGAEQATLRAIESELGREIEVRARADLHQERFEITALEDGEAVPLSLPWLIEEAEEAGATDADGDGDGDDGAASTEATDAADDGDGTARAEVETAPPPVSPAPESAEAADADAPPPTEAMPAPPVDEARESPILRGSGEAP